MITFIPDPCLAVEPCVGGGAFVRGFASLVDEWVTCDVRAVPAAHTGMHVCRSFLDARQGRDFCTALARAEIVITNPPFSLAQAVVQAAWRLCPNANIWILQRRTWHDQARAEWFARHQPDELTIARRIRFRWPDGLLVGAGTDNCLHTLYGFSRARGARGPFGGICRTLV
jgi:hypothetical protein